MSARVRPVPNVAGEPVPSGRLWLGLVGAPAAWLVTEFAGYILAARSCEAGRNGINAYGVNSPSVVVGVLALAMLAVAAGATWIAGGNLRRLGAWPRGVMADGGDAGRPAEWCRARFMAVAGILAGALFALGIVLIGLPPFLVHACSEAR
jgi:hypothetical protein